MGWFLNTDKRTKLGKENALNIAILKFLIAPFKYLLKFLIWFYKYFFIYSWKLVKWLWALFVVVLKFIFGLIKKLFIKAADQDGDGDVDFEDVKLVLKRFTAEGRADKLEKKATALEMKRESLDRLAAAREKIAKEK